MNKVSQDHIGCLVHGIFNASIPASEIPFSWEDYMWHDGNHPVTTGTGISFSVTGKNTHRGLLSITGSLKKKGAGRCEFRGSNSQTETINLEAQKEKSNLEAQQQMNNLEAIDKSMDKVEHSNGKKKKKRKHSKTD